MADRFNFRIVQLHLTDKCNLRCSYCYEVRAKRSRRFISVATAQEIAARHLCEDGPHEIVEFDFIGGEPLFVWELIVSMVEYVHHHGGQENAASPLPPTAPLFTDEMKAWLDRHACAFRLVLTVRAPHMTKIATAPTYARSSTSPGPCARLKMEPRVKMTISADTVPMMTQGIAELHEMGFAKIDANVPYENIWGDRLELSLAAFAEQLDAIVESYFQRLT